ncbi:MULTISPECIES: hypothetical protein [unclassified Streptomyces]|uniref:hypothetical protein n=1 Tax=unclassified Streptomyces TaxID=2593676 RepID=UPI002DDBCC14|nr:MULTISPECIES: hypothetical protein [unclassified Streptomyces]WSC35541.1 hypothetical protein OHA08_08540 [Streptomyces sp. NBC_01763]WSG79668.1 hypothetical protein OIE76_06850 [Streptomyces sp. NBC_01727]
MGAPDIVVPVREGAVNEQLRYALRSWAAHLPHGRVWLVGHRPQWAAGVGHIPTRQAGTKYQNTTVAVRAACEHPDVSERFLLCNDDFFAMHPVEEMPVFHRGPVRRVEAYYAARASGKYLRGMRETRELLESLGHPEPLSYELHVPLPVDRAGMLNVLEVGRHLDVVHKRSLYGNLAQLGGAEIRDVKILHRAPRGYGPDSPFLSTMPDSFAHGHIGQFIRRAFPEPSRYETRRR